MDRRFFSKQALSGMLAGLAIGTPAIVVAASPNTAQLLRNPAAFIGTRFVLEDGTSLQLSNVTSSDADASLAQWTLEFKCSQPITEGIHRLRISPQDDGVDLFLQGHQTTAIAYISRPLNG